MLYIVFVVLAVHNTIELRRLLRQNGFIIYLVDESTGNREPFEEPANSETLLLYPDNRRFECYYNSPTHFPPTALLDKLSTAPGVGNFVFERKVYNRAPEA